MKKDMKYPFRQRFGAVFLLFCVEKAKKSTLAKPSVFRYNGETSFAEVCLICSESTDSTKGTGRNTA